MANFEAQEKKDLSFKKNELLQIIATRYAKFIKLCYVNAIFS